MKGKIYSLLQEFNYQNLNPAKRLSRKHYDSGKNISLSYNADFYPVQRPFKVEAKNISRQASSSGFVESLNNREDFVVESFEEEQNRSIEISPTPSNTADRPVPGPLAPPVNRTESNRIANLEEDLRPSKIPAEPDQEPGYNDARSFEEDLKDILSGAKVYDSNDKTVKHSGAQTKQEQVPGRDQGTKDKKHPHAIFDQITSNLAYANSFDLGTKDIEKSFDEYDKDLNRSFSSQGQQNNFTKAPLDDMDFAEDFQIISEISSREDKAPQITVDISSQQQRDDPEPLCWQEGTDRAQVSYERNLSVGLTTPPELTELLSYLHIDYTVFQPVETRYFTQLAALLTHNNIITAGTIIDRTNFRDPVRRFQQSKNLTDDGIPGADTLWELQVNWAGTRNLSIVRVTADQVPQSGGYNNFRLRSDVVPFYNNLRTQVLANHGIITSAGSMRDLTAAVTAGRSNTSMHYTGIAFDLATDTGMSNTTANPYLITRQNGGWHVWNKPSQSGVSRTLDAVIYGNHNTRIEQVTANTIDFTDMANRNGFRDIGPRSCFPQEYSCAEWWHFQCEEVLTPYISQFGIELLSLGQYNQTTLSAHTGIWQNRKNIFKRNWF